jgi:dethiobiotin synthetase
MIYFVTAIHTNSGKTLVSAILTKALQADYWKPVQSGGDERDSEKVEYLINNNHSLIYDESYLLKAPLSPHAASRLENIEINLDNILLPDTSGNDLIIEGAGGILTPLNKNHCVIDIAEKFDAQVILVSDIYLGSINHTLLSINELKRRKLNVRGIVFNGMENPDTESYILSYSGYPCLLRIRPEKDINEETVSKYAIKLFETWHE